MSRNVWVDMHQASIRNCDALINVARQQLQAEVAKTSCRRSDVKLTNIAVDSSAYQRAQREDKLESRDTRELETKLGSSGPALSASSLGDWRVPVEVHDDMTVDEYGSVNGNLRWKEDLQCGALDGAWMTVFEELDESGQVVGLKVGLEDVLFDHDGQWRNPAHKKAYEQFLDAAMQAQGMVMGGEENDDAVVPLSDAMNAAGLVGQEVEELEGERRRTIFATQQARVNQPQVRRTGGRS